MFDILKVVFSIAAIGMELGINHLVEKHKGIAMALSLVSLLFFLVRGR